MVLASLSNPNRSLQRFLLSFDRLFAYSTICVTHERFHHHHLPILLQSCSSSLSSSPSIEALHALIIVTSGYPSPQYAFLHNNLISSYMVRGEVWAARKVFDKMVERNAVSYNSIISAYSCRCQDKEAMELFLRMMESGLKPTQFTFGCLLRSSPLDWGVQLQALILKTGYLCSDAFSGTALLGVFAKHGCLKDMVKLFREMPEKNIVTWNVLISAFSKNGSVVDSVIILKELIASGCCLSEYSFVCILSALQSVEDFITGEQIHGLVVRIGMHAFTIVMNSLINMYEKCCSVFGAEKIFNEMPTRDLVSWNSIITAYTKSEQPDKALELLLNMTTDGFRLHQATFASMINSCTKLKVLNYGKYIHAKSIKRSFDFDIIVGSALIDFYVKCYDLEDAHCLFDEMDEKNIVTWNSLLLGYANVGSSHSVHVLKQMLPTEVRPDQGSFSAVLKCASISEVQLIHSMIIKMGHCQDDYVASSLISSYANNGLDSEALAFPEISCLPLSVVQSNIVARVYNRNGLYAQSKALLLQLKEPDIISWNSLIEAFARSGEYREAFELFKRMQYSVVIADNCTFTCLLSICSRLCNLALGSTLHGLIIKTDICSYDTLLHNMLINMYSECGYLEGSMKVFKHMDVSNVISWTALISGFAHHGFPFEALEKFKEMEVLGFKPDRIAFIAVLSACRHGGLVEEGMRLFEKMNDIYGIEPDMDHYACIVDMLCRHGQVKEAEQVICGMPFSPNAVIWRSFLEGCKRYGTVKELQG